VYGSYSFVRDYHKIFLRVELHILNTEVAVKANSNLFCHFRFANAVGAFIYPMYGHGELPQAFCRCAAVKGALYVRFSAENLASYLISPLPKDCYMVM
jgi:GDP dissociation inhibitor